MWQHKRNLPFWSVMLGGRNKETKQDFMQNIRSDTEQTRLSRVEQSAIRDAAAFV